MGTPSPRLIPPAADGGRGGQDYSAGRPTGQGSGLASCWFRWLEERLLHDRQVGEIDDAVAVQVDDRVLAEEREFHAREIAEVHDTVLVEIGIAGVPETVVIGGERGRVRDERAVVPSIEDPVSVGVGQRSDVVFSDMAIASAGPEAVKFGGRGAALIEASASRGWADTRVMSVVAHGRHAGGIRDNQLDAHADLAQIRNLRLTAMAHAFDKDRIATHRAHCHDNDDVMFLGDIDYPAGMHATVDITTAPDGDRRKDTRHATARCHSPRQADLGSAIPENERAGECIGCCAGERPVGPEVIGKAAEGPAEACDEARLVHCLG